MELRWVRTFVAVAQELNYGRAAEKLHVSQPAVSQQIFQLEKAVGVRLVDRTTRSVALTRAGEAFLPLSLEVLAKADEAVRAARNSERNDHGVVRIGFAGAMGSASVGAITRLVRSSYPGIELRFQAALGSAEVLDLVAAGGLDIGFTAGQRSVQGVRLRTIDDDSMGCLVPLDHPIALRDSVKLASLRDVGFVLLDPSLGLRLREEAIEACVDVGFRPRVVQDAPDSSTLFALVAAGVGVSITAGRFAASAQGTAFVPFSDVTRRLRTVVAWREDPSFGALQHVLGIIVEIHPTVI